MTVLSVADLAFGYGADKLFQGVTFTLEPGQRAALVARAGQLVARRQLLQRRPRVCVLGVIQE